MQIKKQKNIISDIFKEKSTDKFLAFGLGRAILNNYFKKSCSLKVNRLYKNVFNHKKPSEFMVLFNFCSAAFYGLIRC